MSPSVIVIFISALLIGTGLTFVALDIFHVPSIKTSKAVSGVLRQRNTGESPINVRLEALARKLSEIIKLSPSRRENLKCSLAAADKQITPERHVADCIIKAAVVAIFIIPAAFIFPLSVPVILIFAAAQFSEAYNAPAKLTAHRKEAIENELPMFCQRIESMLGHTRDVVQIISSYRKNAGPEMKKELGITLADIHSGDAHTALTRLEARIGSPHMSEITRGLIAVLDGNDPVGYWSNLSLRMSDSRKQSLLRRAGKIPEKINRLSLCLLGCVMIIYIAVIGSELLRSIGVLFG